MANKLFRESALERLSSPEQLDQILQVTGPMGWLALSSMWLILGAVVVWSVLGRLPTQEEGHGMIVSATGLHLVESMGTGRLLSISKGVGEGVQVGEVVASIDKQDLEDQRQAIQSQLSAQRNQHDRLLEQDKREKEAQDSLARLEDERLRNVIGFAEARFARFTKRRTTATDLVAQGKLQPIDVEKDIEKIDDEIEIAKKEIEVSRLAIQQQEARSKSADSLREREQLTRQLKIDDLERQIGLLESRIRREGQVVSTVAGKVLEVRAAVGAVVGFGDPVLLIGPAGEQKKQLLEAVLYVSATGKQITLGKEVMLLPSTVKREEYGSLLGRIEYVAENPTSRQAMMVTLKDPALVERFSREIGVPREIRVQFTPDTTTATGYKWTSVTGPPKPLSAGTLCTGWVTVKEQRPISLVIPLFDKSLGLE